MNALSYAQSQDANDPLAAYRQQFHLPFIEQKPAIYLSGNSLGLQAKQCADAVQDVMDTWAQYGVEGHFEGRHPWLSYHELLTKSMANLVGAKPEEVVCMNGLSVNLHLLMVSFYRPTSKRYKILLEGHAFPSDQYVAKSQAAFHGFDPHQAVITTPASDKNYCVDTDTILATLEAQGDEIALVLFSGVNYLSGQVFDMQAITEKAHAMGCVVGFDLAHAAGNILLSLHEWQVDFAAWCSYKYLNAGPGSVASVFIHERHLRDDSLPRFNGWWGHDKATRFTMPDNFKAIPTAEAWQLSNPPILAMAALRASLALFDEVGMPALREKSLALNAYLIERLHSKVGDRVEILTPLAPESRGCQLSLRCKQPLKKTVEQLKQQAIICDAREPDVIRIAPVPFYNSFEDLYHFVQAL